MHIKENIVSFRMNRYCLFDIYNQSQDDSLINVGLYLFSSLLELKVSTYYCYIVLIKCDLYLSYLSLKQKNISYDSQTTIVKLLKKLL